MKKAVHIECTVKAISDEHADHIFRLSGMRLLHVSGWSMLKDSLLPASEHRDVRGEPVKRAVRPDDYINLTSRDLRPFGWMKVDQVIDGSETYGKVAFTARPLITPYESGATERLVADVPVLFRVVQKGLEVTAGLIIDASPLAHATIERLGVYHLQWRSLVNGILSDLSVVRKRVTVDA